jgi:hypothetical protein
MAHSQRPLPFGSRLTASDVEAIGDHVADKLGGRISSAIRTEFARMGLAVDGEANLIDVQKDHAFLRAARERAEDTTSTVRRQVIAWLVPVLCLALVAGLATMLAHKF